MERSVAKLSRDPLGRYLFDIGRKTYYFWTEAHALKAFELLTKEKQ